MLSLIECLLRLSKSTFDKIKEFVLKKIVTGVWFSNSIVIRSLKISKITFVPSFLSKWSLNLSNYAWKYLFEFLDKKEQTDESYQNLSKLLSNHNFNTNETEIKPFISIITNIHSNHHRSEGFNEKIFHIYSLFLDILKQKNHYSNRSLFNIFKNDKRILLFLIEQEVLTIDEEIKEIILKNKNNNNNYYKYLIENNKENHYHKKWIN